MVALCHLKFFWSAVTAAAKQLERQGSIAWPGDVVCMRRMMAICLLSIISFDMEVFMDENVKAAVAGGAGAATGAAGAVGAVSALGVSGLGATGITSGLAAVGGVVGGGMAAGMAVTAAAPIAVGAVAYGLYKWLKD